MAAQEVNCSNPKAQQEIANEELQQILPVLSFGNKTILQGTKATTHGTSHLMAPTAPTKKVCLEN